MKTLNLTLGLHSEVWEDKENKGHQQKIEQAQELQGIQYISSPRPNQRGGGAAISLISGEFKLTKLDVIIPKNLEVVWGLVRPKQPTTDFKGIVVCCFYSVPSSRKKAQLVQHIAINHANLKSKYKDCFFLTGGDKNDLDVGNILDLSPALHMHNTNSTYAYRLLETNELQGTWYLDRKEISDSMEINGIYRHSSSFIRVSIIR